MQYLLLNPLSPEIFGGNLTETEFLEALEEFGCKAVMSEGNTDTGTVMYWYAVAKERSFLENLCNTVDLEGNIIEFTNIYDQILEVV